MIHIKNIIFDLGEVLLKQSPVKLLDNLKVNKLTYNNLKRFFEDWENLDLGYESLEDKYNKCMFPKEYDTLYKDFLINYYKYREINSDLINCINQLKSNNYKVYILSDNNMECLDYYKRKKKFNSIDGFVLSCEYHVTKKDGTLFDILLEKYNLDPSECYLIDDKFDNIDEAKKHDIKGYVFDENKNINYLYNDMRNNDINI